MAIQRPVERRIRADDYNRRQVVLFGEPGRDLFGALEDASRPIEHKAIVVLLWNKALR